MHLSLKLLLGEAVTEVATERSSFAEDAPAATEIVTEVPLKLITDALTEARF